MSFVRNSKGAYLQKMKMLGSAKNSKEYSLSVKTLKKIHDNWKEHYYMAWFD